jgi:hypothetical protein
MDSRREAFQKVSRKVRDCARAFDSWVAFMAMRAQEATDTPIRSSRTASSMKDASRMIST